MMNEKLKTILQELREGFELLYGPRLEQVMLYGSQARGTATLDSDIDVLVVLRGFVDPVEEIYRSGELISRISLVHDELISCVFVSDQTVAEAKHPLIKNVQREGVLL